MGLEVLRSPDLILYFLAIFCIIGVFVLLSYLDAWMQSNRKKKKTIEIEIIDEEQFWNLSRDSSLIFRPR